MHADCPDHRIEMDSATLAHFMPMHLLMDSKGRALSYGPTLARVLQAHAVPGARFEDLFERLKAWRARVALETDKPAYTVLVDSALAAIAETRPASMADLARVKGIGPAKLDRFGPALLAVVAG